MEALLAELDGLTVTTPDPKKEQLNKTTVTKAKAMDVEQAAIPLPTANSKMQELLDRSKDRNNKPVKETIKIVKEDPVVSSSAHSKMQELLERSREGKKPPMTTKEPINDPVEIEKSLKEIVYTPPANAKMLELLEKSNEAKKAVVNSLPVTKELDIPSSANLKMMELLEKSKEKASQKQAEALSRTNSQKPLVTSTITDSQKPLDSTSRRNSQTSPSLKMQALLEKSAENANRPYVAIPTKSPSSIEHQYSPSPIQQTAQIEVSPANAKMLALLEKPVKTRTQVQTTPPKLFIPVQPTPPGTKLNTPSDTTFPSATVANSEVNTPFISTHPTQSPKTIISDKGKPIDKKRIELNKIFIRACTNGDLDQVENMLEMSFEFLDFNKKDDDGSSPLIYGK